jgi:hypothetical protein
VLTSSSLEYLDMSQLRKGCFLKSLDCPRLHTIVIHPGCYGAGLVPFTWVRDAATSQRRAALQGALNRHRGNHDEQSTIDGFGYPIYSRTFNGVDLTSGKLINDVSEVVPTAGLDLKRTSVTCASVVWDCGHRAFGCW